MRLQIRIAINSLKMFMSPDSFKKWLRWIWQNDYTEKWRFKKSDLWKSDRKSSYHIKGRKSMWKAKLKGFRAKMIIVLYYWILKWQLTIFYNRIDAAMLVTCVGAEKCWWQVWGVGPGFSYFCDQKVSNQHLKIFAKKRIRHQHLWTRHHWYKELPYLE